MSKNIFKAAKYKVSQQKKPSERAPAISTELSEAKDVEIRKLQEQLQHLKDTEQMAYQVAQEADYRLKKAEELKKRRTLTKKEAQQLFQQMTEIEKNRKDYLEAAKQTIDSQHQTIQDLRLKCAQYQQELEKIEHISSKLSKMEEQIAVKQLAEQKKPKELPNYMKSTALSMTRKKVAATSVSK